MSIFEYHFHKKAPKSGRLYLRSDQLPVTGSIAGVGLSRNFWGVQWSMMHRIFLTWILTIPATAIIAAAIVLLK